MNDLVLKAQKREENEKLNVIRAEDMVPCVVYGGKAKNTSIKVANSDLIKVYRKAGSSSIISLDVEGKSVDVLIHDFQKNPTIGNFLHVDFYAITKGQAVTTSIRLNFVGESEALREGAILEEQIKELEVTVLPKNLVESFDVDLSILKEFGDAIRVKDLGLDLEKFELTNDLEDLVAIANEPKKVVVEDTAPEASEVPVAWEEGEEKAEEA